MKILIVEDEQRSREGLCNLIRKAGAGYEIIGQASNGAAALELILQQKPDLVFTDIKMPVMDGIALISAVRAKEIKTEFVIVSGYADFEYARQSISLDVAEYLLKPVTQEDVEQILKKIDGKLNETSQPHGSGEGLKGQYPYAHPAVAKALEMIENEYAGRISQRDLADELNISAEYFSYLFSKNVGMTFSEFLRRYRVEKAKELYETRACPKQEVPYAVGFSDAKYFAQVFRSFTGQSPAEFIRAHNL